MTQQASGEVEISLAVGLHARPSLKLAKLAKSFASSIFLALDAAGPWFEAKSVATLMRARMPQGTHIYIVANGQDAQEAVEAIIGLIRRDFDEAITLSNNE